MPSTGRRVLMPPSPWISTSRVHLPRHSASVLLGFSVSVPLVASAVMMWANTGWSLPLVSLTSWLIIAGLVVAGLSGHDFEGFGLANTVTTLRAAMTALLAGLVPSVATLQPELVQTMAWGMTLVVLLSLLLDGVDGYLARSTGQSSRFGARYDMEIDALLALVVCVLLWRTDQAGVWVLGLGIMRYLFITASWRWPALAGDLYPSLRRKCVCVLQVGSLCVMLAPVVQPPASTAIGLAAMALLMWSFARDVRWLLSR